MEEVHTVTEQLELPEVNSVVMVVVTAIVTATRFYVQMPLGSKSALHKSMKKQGWGTGYFHKHRYINISVEAESAVISRIFFKLLEEMRYVAMYVITFYLSSATLVCIMFSVNSIIFNLAYAMLL